MNCTRCSDYSSPETHPLKNLIGSFKCRYCNERRLKRTGIFVLVFIVPICLFLPNNWGPIVEKETQNQNAVYLSFYIYSAVSILWWAALGMLFHYKEKIKDLKIAMYEKEDAIKDTRRRWNQSKETRNQNRPKRRHDFIEIDNQEKI